MTKTYEHYHIEDPARHLAIVRKIRGYIRTASTIDEHHFALLKKWHNEVARFLGEALGNDTRNEFEDVAQDYVVAGGRNVSVAYLLGLAAGLAADVEVLTVDVAALKVNPWGKDALIPANSQMGTATNGKSAIHGPDFPAAEAQTHPSVQLTESEEREHKRLCFKSRLPIVITGEVEGQSRNVVIVAGKRVLLPPKQFEFFLRLVSELKKGGDGYVSKEECPVGRNLNDYSRAVYDLRNAFQYALESQPVKRDEFIETKKFHVRLSTYPRYVDWDRVKRTKLRKPRLRSSNALGMPSSG